MKTISNYKELVAERTRLEAELRNQKLIIKAEIEEIKSKFEPIGDVISMLGIAKGKDGEKSSVLQTGVSRGIDFLVRDNLLARAGWATKVLLPAALKGFSKFFLNKMANNTKAKTVLNSVDQKLEIHN